MAITLLARGDNDRSISSASSAAGTPTSHIAPKPTEAVEGTFILMHLCMSIPGNAVTNPFDTPPTGWTEITTQWRSSGTLSLRYSSYYKFMEAGEPSSWTWTYPNPANVASMYEVYGGVDTADPVAEYSSFVASTGSTSRATPTLVTSIESWITYSAADRNASNPAVPAPDTDTKLNINYPSDVSLTLAYSGLQAAGSYQRTMTGAANTSAYTTAIYALTPGAEGPPPPPGLPVGIWNGTTEDTAYMTVWNGSTEDEAVSVEEYAGAPGGFVVADLLADEPFYVAHRGGSLAYPEMTKYAYDQAVADGYKALEVSVYQCSTGEFVCSHDWTTERVTGIRHEIWETPWSTLSTLMVNPPAENPSQPARPLTLLTEVLDAYAETHVIFIDPKELGSKATALLDLIDTYPNSTDHFVFKTFKAGHAEAAAAQLRGYTTWGCYFTDEALSNPEYFASFDLLGIEYNSTETNRAPIMAQGKPVIAHTINSQTSVNTAVAFGADGMMCTRPDILGP